MILDSNGILSASATHEGAGKEASITVDANTRKRLTPAEIDDLVEKAEEMKVLDEREENRIHARNRLIAFCSHVKVDSEAGISILHFEVRINAGNANILWQCQLSVAMRGLVRQCQIW